MRPSQYGKRQHSAGVRVRSEALRATFSPQVNRLYFAAQGRGGAQKPGRRNCRVAPPARAARSANWLNAVGKAIAKCQSVASAIPVSSRPKRWGSWMPLASMS